MINSDGSLTYIENVRLVKSFLDNSPELAKLRTKYENGRYAVNGLLVKKMGDFWTVSFLAPERLKPKTYILTGKNNLTTFKGLFNEVLDEKYPVPIFLTFSKSLDDNLFVNLELKNYLMKVFNEAGGF